MLEGTCHCGAVVWHLNARPQSITACNCTVCRRYGVLWAYGHIGHDIHVEGKTASYRRKDGGDIDFHFCATCASVTHYVGRIADRHGRYRTAVNMRLTDPDGIAGLHIRHFDGLDTFNELPRDGRTVRDMWF